MTTTSQIHVTRISNGSVYGHSTTTCDGHGCSGHERYYPSVDATGVEPGDVVAEPAVTDRQISALREEALTHGDLAQARICDLAQFGEVERSAFAELSEVDQRRIAAMSQEEAWTECERVIRNAQAQS